MEPYTLLTGLSKIKSWKLCPPPQNDGPRIAASSCCFVFTLQKRTSPQFEQVSLIFGTNSEFFIWNRSRPFKRPHFQWKYLNSYKDSIIIWFHLSFSFVFCGNCHLRDEAQTTPFPQKRPNASMGGHSTPVRLITYQLANALSGDLYSFSHLRPAIALRSVQSRLLTTQLVPHVRSVPVLFEEEWIAHSFLLRGEFFPLKPETHSNLLMTYKAFPVSKPWRHWRTYNVRREKLGWFYFHPHEELVHNRPR